MPIDLFAIYGFAAAAIFLMAGFIVQYVTLTYLAIRYRRLSHASAAMVISSFLLLAAIVCLVGGVSVGTGFPSRDVLAALTGR